MSRSSDAGVTPRRTNGSLASRSPPSSSPALATADRLAALEQRLVRALELGRFARFERLFEDREQDVERAPLPVVTLLPDQLGTRQQIAIARPVHRIRADRPESRP